MSGQESAPRWWTLPLRVSFGALRGVGLQILAFILAMALSIGLMALLNYAPSDTLSALREGSFGTTSGLSVSISHAIPEMLAATGVWLAYRAGLFNIGVDGQLQMGGLACLVVTLALPSSAPGPVLMAGGLLAAFVAGGVWSGMAGLLKALRGANEVISTIMLNFIAFLIITQLVNGPMRDRSASFTTATRSVPLQAQLGSIVPSTGITWAIVLALVISIATILVVGRTNIGLRLSAIGLNREASIHAGIDVPRFWIASFALSGALAGLAGGLVILGTRYYIAPGWAEPWGFFGILIAFLSLSNPLLIPLWSLLFGMLEAAGPTLKASTGAPDAIVVIMQTLPVVILFTLAAMRSLPSRALGRLTTSSRKVT